jgi:D-alanine-D-alanine ligase
MTFQVIVLHRALKFADPELVNTVITEDFMKRFEESIRTAGFNTRSVRVEDDIETVLKGFDPAKTVYFNCCEGTDDDPNGYDPITGLLEGAGYIYTGACDPVLVWSYDKGNTKTRLVKHNIPTPDYAICIDGDSRSWKTFPALVKPVNQHGSFGITRASVVDTPDELETRVREVHATWGQTALVEDFIDGPEYRVYILGNEQLEVLPLYATYYDAAPDYHDHIWGYENKWTESGTNDILRYELPAVVSAELQAEIERVATESYRICEARDYGTVDIRVRDGVPYVLDVNQNPDISEGYSFAQSAQAGGCTYPELLGKIVLLAAERLPK